jgi:hypothetical protein
VDDYPAYLRRVTRRMKRRASDAEAEVERVRAEYEAEVARLTPIVADAERRALDAERRLGDALLTS